ncbi:hypothetical protein GTO10_01985 [Candidatus Saccharibacteria bacterium]|nr:hypothetical protein [Candidatus Saccharibacteria bacterium]
MKIILSSSAAAIASLGLAQPVFAASAFDFIEDYLGISLTACSTEEISGIFCIIARIVDVLLGLAGTVAVLFLIYGGIQYMMSGGDEKSLSTAKATITYSILGLVLIIAAIFIVNLVLTSIAR